jgi:hypothetical protein
MEKIESLAITKSENDLQKLIKYKTLERFLDSFILTKLYENDILQDSPINSIYLMSKDIFSRIIDSINTVSIDTIDIESTTMDSNEVPIIRRTSVIDVFLMETTVFKSGTNSMIFVLLGNKYLNTINSLKDKLFYYCVIFTSNKLFTVVLIIMYTIFISTWISTM